MNQASASQAGQRQAAALPPKTHGAAVQQARNALRRLRSDLSSSPPSLPPKNDPLAPWRFTLDLPLPVSDPGGGAPAAWRDRPFGVADEADWPGGQLQRFRAFRQCADALLEGYNSTFVGMLESPADGLGVWQLKDTAVVCGIVTNAAFAVSLIESSRVECG